MLEGKEEELVKAERRFEELFQKNYNQQESGRMALKEIKNEMTKQKNVLAEKERDFKECEDALLIQEQQFEKLRKADQKQIEEIQAEYVLQQEKILQREGEIQECNQSLTELDQHYNEQQKVDRERIATLEEELGEQANKTFDGEQNLDVCVKDVEKCKSIREQDKEQYKRLLLGEREHFQKEIQLAVEDERNNARRQDESAKERANITKLDWEEDKDNCLKRIGALEKELERSKEKCRGLLKEAEAFSLKNMEEVAGERQRCKELKIALDNLTQENEELKTKIVDISRKAKQVGLREEEKMKKRQEKWALERIEREDQPLTVEELKKKEIQREQRERHLRKIAERKKRDN